MSLGESASIEPLLAPNAEAMLAHLEHLFSDSLTGKIELTWSDPITGALDKSAWFDVGQLEEIVSRACEINRVQGQNVYIGATLRHPDTLPVGRGSDSDYFQSTAFYVDLDDPGVAENAHDLLQHCKPTLAVVTGRRPHSRAQLWWRLDEPETDATRHIERCKALAAHFGGDPAVFNPGRVMRLGGSVAWPRKSGRVLEMTEVLEFTDRPLRMLPGQMERAYPSIAAAGIAAVGNPADRSLISGRLNTGSLLAGITSGALWHRRMVQLTGNWISRGWSNEEILATAEHLTLPGWTVDQTRQEMIKAVDGGRLKWNIPNPAIEFLEIEPSARKKVRILDLDEIDKLQPPTYCIDKLVTETGFTLIWGKQASYKSFVALDMALHMAYGEPYHGREVLPKTILYIAGEGAGGYRKRVAAWRKHYERAGEKAPFFMLETAVNLIDQQAVNELTKEIRDTNFPLEILIIDTVARAMVGNDESDATAMGLFVSACDAIRHEFKCGLIAVHHSGKDASMGPRGSSALPAAVDTDFFLERAERGEIVTVTCQKQKDDEEPAPFEFRAEKIDLGSMGISGETSLVMLPMSGNEKPSLSKHQVNEILKHINLGWERKHPWSLKGQTKDEGRFLPQWISRNYPIGAKAATEFMEELIFNGFLTTEVCDKNTKKSGLKVLKYHEY